jgi:hypothetical protein
MARKPNPAPVRKRCRNCDQWFEINPQAPHKLFCGDACRKEFHRLGSTPRKVIAHVEARLPELVAAKFKLERAALEAIREEISEERATIANLVARFESARHQARGAAA